MNKEQAAAEYSGFDGHYGISSIDSKYKAFLAGVEWRDANPGWVEAIADKDNTWPEIGQACIVVTEYLSRGTPMNDTFAAYMGEDGDCMICGSDDSYGWQFKECVVWWMPLPSLPNTPKPTQP